MVLNTFRRVARKQLQQEAAGKSCLESPQGYLGNGMVHGRLRRRLVMIFFFLVAAGWGARSNYVSTEEPALLDVSSPVAIFNQGWGSFTNRCLMTLLRATANTRKMTTSVAIKWRAGGGARKVMKTMTY